MKKKILIVEDNWQLATLLDELFHEYNCLCTVTGAGLLAKDLILRNKYNLIILDQTLPDMAGFDLLKVIRVRSNDNNVLMIGQESSKDNLNFNFLRKPFAISDFKEAVNNILEIF